MLGASILGLPHAVRLQQLRGVRRPLPRGTHRQGAERGRAARADHARPALPDLARMAGALVQPPRRRRPSAGVRCCEELDLPPNALIGVGVDRLDYTKGIEERLLAVERLLERFPEFRGRFTFIQLAAPSRTVIERYRQYNESVEQLAVRINERFGEGSYRPIVILRRAPRAAGGVPLLPRRGRLLREQPARRDEPRRQGVHRRPRGRAAASSCSASSRARRES